MTKEETISNLKAYLNGDTAIGNIIPLRSVLESALEYLEPSLPSNLDEAALKVYPKMSRLSEPHGVIPADTKTHYLGDANKENRVAFKAGAKWMARQGYTQEGIARPDDCEIWVNMTNTDIKDGDKVVVQIRKK